MFGNNGSRLASWIISFMPVSRWHGLKCFLLRRIGGIKIGKGTEVFSGCWFCGRYIQIGEKCFIGQGVRLIATNDEAPLIIGNNVTFGPNVYASTGAHHLGDASRRSGPGWSRSIVIGDGTAVSVNAIISAGTKIGRGCQIGSGVVAAGKIKDNVMLVQAPPCKVLLGESGSF